jgi:hypothetical protein
MPQARDTGMLDYEKTMKRCLMLKHPHHVCGGGGGGGIGSGGGGGGGGEEGELGGAHGGKGKRKKRYRNFLTN